MHTFELLLILIAACVPLAALAQKLQIPQAVTLVLGGMVLALVPGVPDFELEPELVLALFLPPLLQLSAYRTDWTEFRSNLRPILFLATGAVLFTALVVAVAAKLLVPSLPWWAAITLGAIVAPPDAVAAASILKKLRLPKTMVAVLEGESLFNDAASLVLFRFAVGATVAAGAVSYGMGLLQFAGAAAGGVAIGWITGRLAMWVFAQVDDTLLDITVGLLAGFAAYLAAEAAHASGVLAVVSCGLLLGRQQRSEFSAQTRLEAGAVWGFLEFLLTGVVFILIGLQLRGLLERLDRFSHLQLAALAAAMAATLIGSRFVWMFGGFGIRRLVARGDARQHLPPWRHAAVMGWAGMRGVVSLASALALPARFPGRDVIVFMAFCAILATLLLQGTTLGWLIRRLQVEEPGPPGQDEETVQARAEIEEAARDVVREHAQAAPGSRHHDAAVELIDEFEARAERAAVDETGGAGKTQTLEAQHRLRLEALEKARAKLNDRIDALDAHSRDALMAELDLEERQIRSALGEG